MKRNSGKCAAMVLGLLTLVGCAGPQSLVTIESGVGETVVDMKAGNFKFVPNNIKAYRGVIVFRIENISDTEHNFTLKDPQGHVLQDVDIPPRGTITVKAQLFQPGVYTFYCDEAFHSTLGMKGSIEVVGGQGEKGPGEK